MDASDKSLPDIAGTFKSWIPWRSEPANVSRNFWMPDQSCRVCYECDSQFTWLNRRHHCRLCGRVFCAKCTANWVPTSSSEEREECEKIRVCNYCFKEWEQGLITAVDNEVQVTSLDLSTSPSVTSFISTKSSFTADSSSITLASMPHSGASYQQKQYPSPHQSALMETTVDRQGVVTSKNSDHVINTGVHSPSEFGFFTNRFAFLYLLLIYFLFC